jgi:hypothetical protein
MEGFAEAAVGTSGNGPLHVVPRDEGCDGNDPYVLGERIGFDARTEFEAVEPRHDQIQDQQLRFERRHFEASVIAVGRRCHPISLLTQGQTEHLNDSRVVVDDQDARGDLEDEVFRHGKLVGIEKSQKILLGNAMVPPRRPVGSKLTRFDPLIHRKVSRLAITGNISGGQILGGIFHISSKAAKRCTASLSTSVILKLQNLKNF